MTDQRRSRERDAPRGRRAQRVGRASRLFLVGALALAGADCRRPRPIEATPAGDAGATATVTANATVAPAVSFPLKLSADGRYIVDQRERPFLLQGDSAWSLIAKLKDEDVAAYLEDRRARGFNALIVNLIEHKFADAPPRNAYGVAPFVRPGDFSAPEEAYFAHADRVVERAARAGMAVLLVPCYLGQNGADEGFYREMMKAGAAVMHAYGAWVGRRYAGRDNVVWVLGGDYTPPEEGLAVERALAEGLREGDPRHLFTAHWGAETSALDVADPALLALVDLDTTYTYRPVYEKSLADYRRPGAKPHFLVESTYEGEHQSTPRLVRTQAYDALLTGAVGQNFGNGAVWGFWAWRRNLDSQGARDMTRVGALFAPLPWYRLEPDFRHEVLTDGLGAPATNDYAVLAWTRDGALAVAYVPSARPVTIDLARLRPGVRARWYDPTSGAFSEAAGAPAAPPRPGAEQLRVFDPPGPNAARDSDWVLVLQGSL